jgi:hypothetical protein
LLIAEKYHVGAYNWGLVAGKTQTHLPWDSWKKPYADLAPETIGRKLAAKKGIMVN